MQLMQIERDNVTLRSENATLNGLINLERNKTAIHEKKIETMELNIDELTRRLRERENQVKDLQKELNQKQYLINQKALENEKQKRKFSTKIAAEAEKMNRELNHKFRAEKDLLHVSLHRVPTTPYVGYTYIDCSFSFVTQFKDRLRSKDYRLQSISKIVNNGDIENIDFDMNSRRERFAGSDNVTVTPITPKSNTATASQAFYTPRTTSHRVSAAHFQLNINIRHSFHFFPSFLH